jgi:CheY-like chemotaxis protein
MPQILLAEDNPANVSALKLYLEAQGYQVCLAGNGAEAIVMAQTQHPQLILMDIQMPGVDGLEAIEILRRDPDFEQIPIIALTALAMPTDREQCLAAGATDYLSKPLHLQTLKDCIQKHLFTNI